MNAILVSVDYADLLAITLPYNRHHFDEVCIVTTPEDVQTQKVAREYNSQIYTTRAFYGTNVYFNKWRAFEEALDWFVRGKIAASPQHCGLSASLSYTPPRPRYSGWLCVMDADILWPTEALSGVPVSSQAAFASSSPKPPASSAASPYSENDFSLGNLYNPPRRMLAELPQSPPAEVTWGDCPYHKNTFNEFASYSVIFHTADPHLPSPYPYVKSYPWFDPTWIHAGGADSFFQRMWEPPYKIRLPFDVLHLGEAGVNWCGRASQYVDGSVPSDAESKRKLLTKLKKLRRSQGFTHEKI